MKIYIEQNPLFYAEIKYTWDLFASNANIQYSEVNEEAAEISIGSGAGHKIRINRSFYESLGKGIFSHTEHFSNECLIYIDSQPDYLSSAFYMVNSLQEYAEHIKDEVGRFRYEDSYQFRFGNICKNLVQDYFKKLASQLGISIPEYKSCVFLSHDIDVLHGKIREETAFLVKSMQFHKVFVYMLVHLFRYPYLFNMDKIMAMEDEKDFRSTFFWLVNKGRISRRELNADYSIDEPKVQQMIDHVAKKDWENGLHKSLSSDNFETEIKRLPFQPGINRYHYLKFSVPDGYRAIEQSGLKADASLGFAAHYGMRNSYGRPFQPFDVQKKKKFSFLEIPLHAMDGTFQQYIHTPVDQTAETIIDFFEQNRYNSVLSVLWHNTFFSNFKFAGYCKEYKKLLAYFYESGFKSVSAKQLIEEFLAA